MPALIRILKPVIDFCVTIILWTYYILGYLIFFSPFYLAAYTLANDREAAFQKLNHILYRSFFGLLKSITPGLKIRVSDDVRALKSSVIVSNHLSYLDPILMISLFPQQKTIVKSIFFHTPVFGWILKTSGYIPSVAGGDFSSLMIEQVEGMNKFLASGGNLFIFPEGHRSRNGQLGPFRKGSFSIAKRCKAPISVLRIKNTDKLFTPGIFFFNTCIPNTIEVELVGQIHPDYDSDSFSMTTLMQQVRIMFDNKMRMS